MNKFLFFLFIIIFTGCNQNSKKESLTKNKNNEFQHIIDSAAIRLINKPLINSTSVGVVYKGEKFTGHYGELEKTKGRRRRRLVASSMGRRLRARAQHQ